MNASLKWMSEGLMEWKNKGMRKLKVWIFNEYLNEKTDEWIGVYKWKTLLRMDSFSVHI